MDFQIMVEKSGFIAYQCNEIYIWMWSGRVELFLKTTKMVVIFKRYDYRWRRTKIFGDLNLKGIFLLAYFIVIRNWIATNASSFELQ